MLKVLNLYAGIGGNRKLWKDVDVTAVEINPEIAKIYQDFFPNEILYPLKQVVSKKQKKMVKTKIPHKCDYCNCQLYLENRVYQKGKYYCKKHWSKNARKE